LKLFISPINGASWVSYSFGRSIVEIELGLNSTVFVVFFVVFCNFSKVTIEFSLGSVLFAIVKVEEVNKFRLNFQVQSILCLSVIVLVLIGQNRRSVS